MRDSMRPAVLVTLLTATVLAGCGGADTTPESMLSSAKGYLSKNDNKAAVIQLKNALQKDANLVEARFLLGKALLDAGDNVGAEKELRRALELKYPAEQVVPPLARSMVALGQYKKLKEEFGKTQLTSAQGMAELGTALAQAELGTGNVKAAEDALAKALAAQPKYVPAHLTRAWLLAGTGNLSEALKVVDSALEIAPANAEAWQLKGDIHNTRNEQERALAAYRKAVDVQPGFIRAHAALVSLSMQQNKLEDASAQLEDMKKIAPRHPQTLYLQALLGYRQKNYTAAREAIQEHLRMAPDYMPGLLLAGAVEYQLKAYSQAEAHLYKVLQQNPRQAFARRILSVSYLRSGQTEKALETLKPMLDSAERDPSLYSLAGEIYMMSGQPTQAATYFAKATALDPADARKRTAVAVTHMMTGETDRAFRELEQTAAIDSGIRAELTLIAAHMQRREYDKALAVIAGLEKKQPSSPLPHNLRGRALLASHDVAGARKSFERALQIDPTYFPAAAHLSELDLAEKKPDAARKRFETILATYPRHTQALLALASLQARLGGTSDQVIALIKKAIESNPNETAPRLALIGYYFGKKDMKRAVSAAQEAMAAIPDNAEILEASGRAHQAAGETNQALTIYNKLASVLPGSPQPYLRIAAIQIAAKKNDEAIETLRKALTIAPDSVDAQAKLISLQLDAGRTRDAIAIAKEVQKQRPKSSIGYVFEGDIHAALKKWADAAAAYRAGLAQIGSSDLALKLHSALQLSGSGADQFALSWIREHPKDNAFRMRLAQAATHAGDHRTAAEHYRKMLETAPEDVVVLNNLAWAEFQLKQPQAIEHAEKANKLAPNQPALMDTLGVLLLDKGDTARALDLLQRASTLAPRAAGIRLNLAKALIKSGQKDAARKELDELTKLGDKFSGHVEVTQLKRNL